MKCPYCHNIHSISIGQIFCSRLHPDMRNMESGILHIKANRMETKAHQSRFSLRCSTKGKMTYKVDGKQQELQENQYLLVNQHQEYQIQFQEAAAVNMLVFAFQPGMVEAIFNSLITSEESQLEQPDFNQFDKLDFYNYPLFKKPVLYGYLKQTLQFLAQRQQVTEMEISPLLTNVLQYILTENTTINQQLANIPRTKASTQKEILYRLSLAENFMQEAYAQSINLDKMAQQAMMSKYQFLRLFKQNYQQSPHQYLQAIRLERAKVLFVAHLPVAEIALQVGFSDTKYLVQAFKKRFGYLPTMIT